MEELLRRSALELAELVRSGEISARELVGASLARIDRVDPEINAFAHVAHESAMADAIEIAAGDPRPFAGVPIAIKDNRAVQGMPLTMCSDLFGDFTPGHDTHFVRRLRAAGFVIVGKTALPEMGILPTCESRRNGPTRNPWSLDHTPGGSSGGSAAAVAAGMVPLAHGNDGGGSTRIPASCCGLVGLKAARDRVSVGPESGHSFLVNDCVLTRNVQDTASVLDVIAGYELGDMTWAPAPGAPFAELASAPPGRMKIALALEPALDGDLDPVMEAAARDAAALLESLGHDVEQIKAPWAGLNMLPTFTRVWAPGISMVTMIGARIAGREATEDDVEPLTWTMWERAHELSSLDYMAAQGQIESVSRSVVAALGSYDAVVTPALAQRPLKIGEVHGRGPDPWDHYRRSGAFTPYTAIVNMTGLPAISLPLYFGEDGLPTAVQVIGRPAGEGALLSLATQLEQALPWAQRVAPLAEVTV